MGRPCFVRNYHRKIFGQVYVKISFTTPAARLAPISPGVASGVPVLNERLVGADGPPFGPRRPRFPAAPGWAAVVGRSSARGAISGPARAGDVQALQSRPVSRAARSGPDKTAAIPSEVCCDDPGWLRVGSSGEIAHAKILRCRPNVLHRPRNLLRVCPVCE